MRLAFALSSALVLAVAACAAPAAAPAAPAAGTVKIGDGKVGKILVAPSGVALYTFTADSQNTSACYDSCAQNWLPLTLASGDPAPPSGLKGRLGIATRRDNTRQVTYNGLPLYFFVGDKNPGDANGDGIDSFGGKWSVVKDP